MEKDFNLELVAEVSFCNMSSDDRPGIVDIAVISGVLALVVMSVIAYVVSRCFCRRQRHEDETRDDVRSLERIRNSAFLIPYDNPAFTTIPPTYVALT